jgi:non-homologous end joining protein Ku
VKEYGKGLTEGMKSQEIDLASQFANALIKPLRPEQFHDEYQLRVQELVDSKERGSRLRSSKMLKSSLLLWTLWPR